MEHPGIVASQDFAWSDEQWRGVAKHRLLLYEIHVGTFTRPARFAPRSSGCQNWWNWGSPRWSSCPWCRLRDVGIGGTTGSTFSPCATATVVRGELKAFVDACHARGLAVILDVVYNHLGPEGCVLQDFGPYFSQEHLTPWGTASTSTARAANTCARSFWKMHWSGCGTITWMVCVWIRCTTSSIAARPAFSPS